MVLEGRGIALLIFVTLAPVLSRYFIAWNVGGSTGCLRGKGEKGK